MDAGGMHMPHVRLVMCSRHARVLDVKRVLTLALGATLLASCDRTPAPAPAGPVAFPEATVRLSLGAAPYNFADSVAVGKTFKLGTIVASPDTAGMQTLASGTVASNLTVTGLTFSESVMANAAYTLNLPGEGCTGDAAVTPAGAKLVSVDGALLLTPDQTISGVTTLELSAPANDMAFLVHADEAVTMKGSAVCQSVKATFDVNLKPGWNLVHQVIAPAAGTVTITAETTAKVTYTPPRDMGALSVKTPFRNFLR